MCMAHGDRERYQTLWLWAAQDCVLGGRQFSPMFHSVDSNATATEVINIAASGEISSYDLLTKCRICGSRNTSKGFHAMDMTSKHGRIDSPYSFEVPRTYYTLDQECINHRCIDVSSYFGIDRSKILYTYIQFSNDAEFEKRLNALKNFTKLGKRSITLMKCGELFDAMLIVMLNRGDV